MSHELAALYSKKLLALAADIPHLGQLEKPQITIFKRAPLCGSSVSIDLEICDGKIVRFAQNVKACALGQASAAILGQNVIGRSFLEIKAAHAQLEGFLCHNGPAPEHPFDGFETLLPARDFKNRHASILLAISATLEAFEQAHEITPS